MKQLEATQWMASLNTFLLHTWICMYQIYPIMEFSVHFDGRSLRCIVCVCMIMITNGNMMILFNAMLLMRE